ncbi:MAG: hypothetical protein GIKADHBN_02330 [Phycisphaerales bacterium]|nr:hypothetical protein [Phycisphaerales bacterium]
MMYTASLSSLAPLTNTISGWLIWNQFLPCGPSLSRCADIASTCTPLYVRPTIHRKPFDGSDRSTSVGAYDPRSTRMSPSLRCEFHDSAPETFSVLPAKAQPSALHVRLEPSMFTPRCVCSGHTSCPEDAAPGRYVVNESCHSCRICSPRAAA